MTESVKRTAAIIGRNEKEILRDFISIIFLIGVPVLLELVFYLLFHKLTPQFEIRFLAPGIVVFSQSFLCLFTGQLLSIDRATSFLTRLYVTPARGREFISGYALSLLPVSILQVVVFFVAGGMLDTSFFSVRLLLGIPAALFTSFFFIAAGLLLGSICGERSVGGAASAIVACQSVLSGMWFPREGLSGGMLKVMDALPFRNATLIVQNAVNGCADIKKDMIYPVLIMILYTAATFILAVAVFTKKMKEN